MLIRTTLVFIALIAWLLFTTGNNFPLGFHRDEPKKVDFINRNTQDFMHPILLLQLTRWVNAIVGGTTTNQSIVQVGRGISAVAGVMCVLLLFLLANQSVGQKWATVSAMLAATCPALVLHSHYMKEDMILLAALLASLVTLERFRKLPTTLNAIMLGCCAGLSFSSHYKSILLLPIAGCYLATQPVPKETLVATNEFLGTTVKQIKSRAPSTEFLTLALLSGLVACLVFASVNSPAFEQSSVFSQGIQYEFQHALQGHRGMRISPWNEFFTYHLRNSIISGMTIGMAVLGLFGMLLEVLRFNRATPVSRLMLLFISVFYLAAEFSPSKPPPDEMRYVLPCMIGLVYFAGVALKFATAIQPSGLRNACLVVCVVAGPLSAAVDSVLVAWHVNRDSRIALKAWFNTAGGEDDQVYFSVYSSATPDDGRSSIYIGDILASNSDYWVLSSFTYAPLLYASQFPNQSPQVLREAAVLRDVLKLSNREFLPQYRSIGFSDPTLRVFDLRQVGPQLRAIADAERQLETPFATTRNPGL